MEETLMAKSANYRVQLRRRREGKTDYQARKAMVISRKPRLVVRPSLSNANAQIIIAKPNGDQTLAAANSRELIKKYGWKAPTGNIPAAYLTGLLCGLKAKTAGINEAILDLGLINPTKGAKVFAILHGVVDAGVEVPHGEEKIAADRSKGDHIVRYAKALSSEDAEVYAAKFSKYTAEGVAPEKVAEHFSKVRATMVAAFKDITVAPEPESAPEPKAKPKAPKPEAKPAPKAEAPKAEAKEAKAPKAEAKVEEPKVEAKAAPKAQPEAKPAKVKPAADEPPIVKAPKVKAKAASTEKVTKEEAEAEEAPKEKAPKAKAKAAPKEKAPAKEKAAKKGGKKE
jgi:large subunit ribosomal protein L18